MQLFFCFLALFASWTYAQNQLPFNLTDFVDGGVVYVSPCGVAVVKYQATSALSNFFYDLTFTAVTPVPFSVWVSLKAPGAILDYKSCAPSKTCTTSTSCVLSEGCGDQGQIWYAYVETTGVVEGRFSLSLSITGYPTHIPVPIDADSNVNGLQRFGGGPVVGTPVVQFDWFSFQIGSKPPGTLLKYEVLAETSFVNSYLFKGTQNTAQNAFPRAGCITGTPTVNRTQLDACEVSQGGVWSLAIERRLDSQFYKLRLWYQDPISIILAENIRAPAQLGAVGDLAYFRYNVPAGAVNTLSTVSNQIYFVLDNVVGGTVEIAVYYNVANGKQCGAGLSCRSLEGCHVQLERCQIQSGFYTIVAKAIAVHQPYIDVSFAVTGFLKTHDIASNTYLAPKNVRGSIFLSDYQSFKFDLPSTTMIGDWMDIEVYIDRDLQDDVPASVFVGTQPYPQNSTYTCGSAFYKQCDTRINMGAQRYCFIQLDPCDLEKFTGGVFINVYSNNQINRVSKLQEHTYKQNPMDFTIYTTIRNPNNNLINHGTVITDEVTEGWKKAYKLDDTIRSGALEIAISANYHFNFPIGDPLVINNDTARTEIDVQVIYAQTPYIGPNCLSCYRVQESFSISLKALETYKFIVRKCVQGDEHVYLVITGNNTQSRINATSTRFNFTDNRYVITAKDSPLSKAQSIKPTEFSNIISGDSSFGGLQFWLLDFNQQLLGSSTLALKLRAHPRSGRNMQLIIGDFDPACAPANKTALCGGFSPALTFSCNVNETNKGFCYINIQTCVLIPYIGQTFYVRVASFPRQNLTVPDVPVEYAYSFTYDLIPNVATQVALGKDTQIIVDLEAEIYQHFSVVIPLTSVARDTFIIEAYFDSNNLYSSKRVIQLFLNEPYTTGTLQLLAGNPVHSARCLCYDREVHDDNKVVLLVDRCSLIAGVYYFSIFTDSFGFKEGQSHVTIRAYTVPYVVPINYELPYDFSLFPSQTAAYQIAVDNAMLTSVTRTDKELQIWAFSNIAQYNGSINIRLTNNIGDCGCGQSLTDVNYNCDKLEDTRATQLGGGRCDIIVGMCDLSVGNWYIITSLSDASPSRLLDIHQVTPFTITASKANFYTAVRPLPLSRSDTCDPDSRSGQSITQTVRTEEWQYWTVTGNNPTGFSVYIDNVTFGTLTMYAGSNLLPSGRCNVSATPTCLESPSTGGVSCFLSFGDCTNINYIGVKVVSKKPDTDVRYTISSCIRNDVAAAQTLVFGDLVGKDTVVAQNGAQAITFTMPSQAAAQSPYVIVSVVRPGIGAAAYTVTLERASCGGCRSGGASYSCNNTANNCTIYIPYCSLPADHATGSWQLRINNAGTGASFTSIIFAVPNNIGITGELVIGTTSPFNIPPLTWTNVQWTLKSTDLVPFSTGTQTSTLAFTVSSGLISRFQNLNDGSCLVPFVPLSFTFSTCCTLPGVYTYSFFNRDFLNSQSITALPDLITQSQNHTRIAWPTGSRQISIPFSVPSTFSGGLTRLTEYYTIFPGVEKFGTLLFSFTGQPSVTAFIQRNFLAGPSGHGGCFASQFALPLNSFVVQPILACAASTNPLTPVSVDPYFPQGIWLGFENKAGVADVGLFNITSIPPIEITRGNTQNAFSILNVNQQFFYKQSANNAYINRIFRVTVTVVSGTVQPFVNVKNAAGPAGGCLGNIRTGVVTNAGSSTRIEFPTCPNIVDTIWVGVITSSLTSAYSVLIEEINTLDDASTPAVIIQPNVPLFVTGPAASTNYDFVYPNVLPPMTWLRVSIDNITIGSTYTVTHYRDGSCTPRENTFCSETSNFGYKCTMVIAGCQLQPSVLNHLVVAGPGGASYTITAQIITFGAGGFPITQMPGPAKGSPGENLQTTFTSAVLPHDIALYQVPVNPRDVLPGEDFRLTIDSLACGSIDVYGYVGGQPGPFCTVENKICSAPSCLIASSDQCDTFRASTVGNRANALTDLYALVRGKAHTEGNVAIKFTLRIARFNSYIVRHMYYLEKHNIFPVQPTPAASVAPAVCPASLVPTIQSCCPAVAATSASWIWQPTVFHFPVEGAHFLNDLLWQRVKLSISGSSFIDSASISVWNQQPSFCANQGAPNRASNVGPFTSCSVNRGRPDCTVNLYIPICGLVNSHLLFFTVENMTFTATPLPLTVAEFRNGITVSHTRIPNNIIAIKFSNGARQFFEGDLVVDQIQYFKVYHDQVGTPNYHFNVQVLKVDGGGVALHHLWTGCPNTEVCNNVQCEDLDPRNETAADCKVDPDCQCDYEHIACRTGDMNSATVREGFFHLRGSSLNAGIDIVHFVILVEFIEPMETLANVICGNETCDQERYYNNVPRAGPEELYRFRLTSVAGDKNILLANDDFIGLDGYDNSVQAKSCQFARRCDSLKNGQLDQCVTFYRTVADGTPYVSVHTSAKCTDRRVTRYNLNPDKYTPPIITLTDGQKKDSQISVADPLNPGCSSVNQSYWYKVTTRANFQYMVVEIWGETSEQMQFWVTKNHVSYHAFGENLAIGCQTVNSGSLGQYCRYVVACAYVPGLYYIQVSDSSPKPKFHPYFRHQIRVTSMNAIDNTVPFGQDFSFDIVEDLRQIQTVTITGVSGNQEQAWKDFIAYTFSQTPVDSWMTRNRLGDSKCSISAYVGRTNSQTHTVNECQVDAAGGVFKVHFMINPANVCSASRVVSVTSRFNNPGSLTFRQIAGNPNTPSPYTINANAGETLFIKHTVPVLGPLDIVYARLSNFDTQTRLTATIIKGNHLNVDRSTYALPCITDCTQGNREDSTFMAWADLCSHCGTREYNTVWVKVDAVPSNGNTSNSQAAAFTSTLRVVQATPLTSGLQTGAHAREEASLNFYSSEYTRDKGSRIELVIAKAGAIGVEINVYASDCGLRTNPSQYWCFPGHHCSIPTPERENFGSTYVNGLSTSPYIAPRFLIVVRALDASYTITHTQGAASCAPITPAIAPFCSTFGSVVTSRPFGFWGNTNTFIEKDRNALEFFTNLTKRFSCADGQDHCDCAPLSQICRQHLAIYACLAMLNPCDGDGLELLPSRVDCDNVESTCPKTFRCAGYPERACGSSAYYQPPIPSGSPTFSAPPSTITSAPTVAPTALPTRSPTPATGTPTTPSQNTPAPPTEDAGAASSLFPQWIPGVVIFLIVLVALLLVAVVIGAVLLASGGAPRPSEVDAYQAL